MEKYRKLIKNPHFIKWLEAYAEVNHKLNGWLSNDLYLDEVELPRELYLCLLQKWLREIHNIDVRVANKYRYYYLVKDQQYFDRTTYDTYEQALEVGLLEVLKLVKINNE